MCVRKLQHIKDMPANQHSLNLLEYNSSFTLQTAIDKTTLQQNVHRFCYSKVLVLKLGKHT